jgi:hypothetical protein
VLVDVYALPFIIGSLVHVSCKEVQIIEPTARSIIAGTKPVIAWQAIPGVSRYGVEFESRVPEGPVLFSLDTQVTGTIFWPPQPLTDFRAAVKVLVTAGCPADNGSRLREKAASFQIDTSPLCSAPARIAASGDGRNVEWSAVAAAIRYDVTLLRPDDDAILSQGETRQTFFALPVAGETLVAVIRPYCATGFGPRTSVLVAAAKP